MAQGIAGIAREEGVDLIIMTTHGRSGIARGILGSVTDALTFEATAPIYVIRADTALQTIQEAGLPLGVIVLLDGSKLAEMALDDAIQLARNYQSPIYLLTVIDTDAVQIELAQARSYLERVAQRLAEWGIHAIPEITTGSPGEAIVKAVEQRPDCLVVLTTRGAGGISRWVHGSVADWLIRRAPRTRRSRLDQGTIPTGPRHPLK